MKSLPTDLRVLRMVEPIRKLGELTRNHELQIRRQMGRWESEVEAFNLILLTATHAVAVSALARSSTSFLPPAMSIVRAAMEAGARAMWLLAPDDPFEREGRWLVHLEGEQSLRKRIGAALGVPDDSPTVLEFMAAVQAKLPRGAVIPRRVPKFDALLKEIGTPEKYIVYTLLSQTAHATHHGAGAFRRHLGTKKEFGQFVSVDDWWLPLSTLWWFLAMPLSGLANCCNISDPELLPLTIQEQFVSAQREKAWGKKSDGPASA